MSQLVFESVKKKQVEYSICIPTFKRMNLLMEALESCFKQDTQSSFEIVVSDNDPESDISGIIDLYNKYSPEINFRYYRNEKNLGMFGNWNQLVGLAQADWITILNDDDLLGESFLSDIGLLRKDSPDYLLFSCERLIFDQRAGAPKNGLSRARDWIFKILKNRNLEIYGFDFFVSNKINGTLGAVFHRSVFESGRGFEEGLFPSSDYYFWMYFHLKHPSLRSFSRDCTYRIQRNESLRVELIPVFLKHDEEIKRLYIKQINRFFRPVLKGFAKALVSRSLKMVSMERYSVDNQPVHSFKTEVLAFAGSAIYYSYLLFYVMRVLLSHKRRSV
jgi:glycosyltransferase involved in cell wall biosynthesis